MKAASVPPLSVIYGFPYRTFKCVGIADLSQEYFSG